MALEKSLTRVNDVFPNCLPQKTEEYLRSLKQREQVKKEILPYLNKAKLEPEIINLWIESFSGLLLQWYETYKYNPEAIAIGMKRAYDGAGKRSPNIKEIKIKIDEVYNST